MYKYTYTQNLPHLAFSLEMCAVSVAVAKEMAVTGGREGDE